MLKDSKVFFCKENGEFRIEIVLDDGGRIGLVFRQTMFRKKWVGDSWFISLKNGFSDSGWIKKKEMDRLCRAVIHRLIEGQ